MRRLLATLAVGLAALLGAGPAHAELVYGYSFDKSSYTVGLGGTVDVSVYLTETGGSGDSFVLDSANGVGMLGTGVRLSYGAGTLATVVNPATDIAGNGAFDNFGFGIATDGDSTSAGFTQFASNPVYGIQNSNPLVYSLFLGTFTLTAGSIEGPVTVTAGRFDTGDNLVTGNFNQVTGYFDALDDIVAGATTTITVLPEPATIVGAATVMGMVTIGCWWGRRRRAKAGC